MALPIVPKVEFNFEVIMYITIFVSEVRKAASNLTVVKAKSAYLKAISAPDLHVFAAVVGKKPSSPEGSEDSVLIDRPF